MKEARVVGPRPARNAHAFPFSECMCVHSHKKHLGMEDVLLSINILIGLNALISDDLLAVQIGDLPRIERLALTW